MHFRINDLLQAYQLPQGNSKRSIVSDLEFSQMRLERSRREQEFLGREIQKSEIWSDIPCVELGR